MKQLPQSALDITGFAGLLERIYIMDERQFGAHRIPEAWQGHGQLVYLADAVFKPNKSTGRHSHNDIDVVTLVTQGELHHLGSLGDHSAVREGQIMVQRSGAKGFQHDEQNRTDQRTHVLQLWLLPEDTANREKQGEYQVITPTQPDEIIYQSASTTLRLVTLKPAQTLSAQPDDLLFVIKGQLQSANSTAEAKTLIRLTLKPEPTKTPLKSTPLLQAGPETTSLLLCSVSSPS
ncbi:MAG: pirin family protein [Pseudomonadota bacterium]|nr:pirin family protein [Pseudomonadota bacterium]